MTKKKITVYKVMAQNFYGERCSFCAPYSGEVKYFSKKVARPRPGCGPLAVFDTLEHAKEYLKGFQHSPLSVKEIWKGKAEPSKDTALWTSEGSAIGSRYLPVGTILVDSFTPRTLVLALPDKGK